MFLLIDIENGIIRGGENMIEYKSGNLLESDAEALVNTVNCVGVMGKGIALQFKQAFPENFKIYEKACKNNEVVPGEMFVYSINSMFNPQFIINFPTKRHWKGKSRLEDIQSGLVGLIKTIRQYNIKSVALPPLGCGNGGLNWDIVRPMIEEAVMQIPDVQFNIYAPLGSPDSDKIKIGTVKPKLTRARALLIKIMELYGAPGYKLSLLEVQKLAYFLQESGETLKLNFVQAKYGPYAENLNHVLQRLEGHYIRGYGDRNRKAEIFLLPNAVKEATEFLNATSDGQINKQLEKMKKAIFGFETPYGLELLSTTHWILKNHPDSKQDVNMVIQHFQDWNDRKKQLFREKHIRQAKEHLIAVDL